MPAIVVGRVGTHDAGPFDLAWEQGVFVPLIRYIEHDGTARDVDVPAGWSVMEGAVKNMVPGIVAECGGVCACATCHVYVHPDWVARLAARSDNEDALLEYVDERRETSRLACQIKVCGELDGLAVQTPEKQG